VMEAMPGQTGAGRAERHAAELLAGLHDVQGEAFGLEFDNLIGPLPQPNTRSRSWVTFFRERRLMTMVEAAAREGAIPETLAAGLERLAGKLESLIPDQPRASLVHGDVWSGNVLHEEERITALLDPAPYYAHAEVELAFITLFSTFGTGFFRAYAERRPIDPEFWSTRRDLYNLYPLLVHARLFGGTYVGQLASTAARFL
jgi:fructosamine-3-kinase